MTKAIIGGLVLIIALTGSFFAYSKYVAAKQAQKENEEIARFSSLTFRSQPEILAKAKLKLPTRFRIDPPELEFLKTFPFQENLVTRIGSKKEGTHYGPVGPLIYSERSGRLEQADTRTPIYSNSRIIRVSEPLSIDGYKYAKNEAGDLEVTTRALAALEHIEEIKADRYGNPGYVLRNRREAYIRITTAWRDNRWMITSVTPEGTTGLEAWTSTGGNMSVVDPSVNLIPTREGDYFTVSQSDIDRSAFYGPHPINQ
jgi:hypothetical protein